MCFSALIDAAEACLVLLEKHVDMERQTEVTLSILAVEA